MLLIWRWICFYPARPENTDENQPNTNFKLRTFAITTVTSKKVKVFTRKLLFCSNLYVKQNDLTTKKAKHFCLLQISLTMPNFSFGGQHELSTGLQLQQKDQNHTAMSHCCQTRSQVVANDHVNSII